MRHATRSTICLVAMLCIGLAVPLVEAFDGFLANATVSFGQWQTDPASPLDRFPNNSPPAGNEHQLRPGEVLIKAGGRSNFIISGFHQVIAYDTKTRPLEIHTDMTTPTTGTPAGVPLINDLTDRLYRGLDPSLHPRDCIEAVTFPQPGLYLVICGIHDHFVNDRMYGFVRVLP